MKSLKHIGIIFRIIVTIAIVLLIYSMLDIKDILNAFSNANYIFILYALLLVILQSLCRILKWQLLVNSVSSELHFSFYDAFKSYMLGLTLGSVTPMEIGEFAGRAIATKNNFKSAIVGLAILDKTQIFIITMMFGSIGLLYMYLSTDYLNIYFSVIIIIIGIIIFFKLHLIGKIVEKINSKYLKKTWINKINTSFAVNNFDVLVKCFTISIVFFLLLSLQMYFLISAFENISLIHSLIGFSLIMLIKSNLPISIGDIGVREISSIYILSLFGVSKSVAFNSSVLIFIINVVVPSLIGLLYFNHKNILKDFYKT